MKKILLVSIFAILAFIWVGCNGDLSPAEVDKSNNGQPNLEDNSCNRQPDSQKYYLYVYTVDERLKPNTEESGKSNDASLNRIFEDFCVVSYYQSFPSAKTPELLNYYSVYFTGDVDSLENLLKNIFEQVYRVDYYEPA